MRDILSGLTDRGCYHLVIKILLQLNSWDLEVASHVSTRWRDIIFGAFWASRSIRSRVSNRRSSGHSTFNNLALEFPAQVIAAGTSDYFTYEKDAKTNFYLLWFILLTDGNTCILEEWVVFEKIHKVRSLHIQASSTEVTCADYQDDLLVVGESTGLVHVHQTDAEACECISVISSHTKAVLKVLISGSVIVSCGEDCAVTVIKITGTGALVMSHILQGHVSRVRCLSVSAPGDLLLTGSDDRTARLWDLSDNVTKALLTLSPHRWGLTAVKLSQLYCFTVDSKEVLVWSLKGELLTRLSVQYTPSLLYLDPDLDVLLIGDVGGFLSGYNLQELLSEKRGGGVEKAEAPPNSWTLLTGQEKCPTGSISLGMSTLVYLSFSTRTSTVDVSLHDFL